MKKLKVCIALCQELLSLGIKQIILEHDEFATLYMSRDLSEVIDCLDTYEIDILIFDCKMINSHNMQFIPNVLKANPDLKIILCTEKFDYKKFKKLYQLGLSGILNPHTEISYFKKAYIKILKGKKILDPNYIDDLVHYFCETNFKEDHQEYTSLDNTVYPVFLNELSFREKQILNLICDGHSSKEISKNLNISPNTVETHRRNILQKFGAKNTAEMVKIGVMAQYESSITSIL